MCDTLWSEYRLAHFIGPKPIPCNPCSSILSEQPSTLQLVDATLCLLGVHSTQLNTISSLNSVVWHWLGDSWVASTMSQFAHGISSLEFTTTSALATPVWLLGSLYENPETDVEAYESHFHSILWFTYRRDFTPMEPYDYTSDAGWGCMLRSAQMMLSGALQRCLLGRDWRVPVYSTSERLPSEYTTILQWFLDAPEPECLFSIHHMVKVGYQYDQLPGEWYGPTTAAQVLRDLVNLHCREKKGSLTMYVPQEGVVYSDDVYKLVVSYETLDTSSLDGFYDPLLHVPQIETTEEWTRSVLILIPLRLGLDSLNECYIPAIQHSFTFPQSIGIIGGKKGHSVYFVGSQQDKLHLLDPHHVHPTTEFNTSFPTATHLSTVHSPKPLVMNLDSIDPSMALGFVCTCRSEYLDFCHRVETMQKELGMMACPFSVSDRRPDYNTSEIDLEEMDRIHDQDVGHSTGEDEEYVLI